MDILGLVSGLVQRFPVPTFSVPIPVRILSVSSPGFRFLSSLYVLISIPNPALRLYTVLLLHRIPLESKDWEEIVIPLTSFTMTRSRLNSQRGWSRSGKRLPLASKGHENSALISHTTFWDPNKQTHHTFDLLHHAPFLKVPMTTRLL